MDLELAGRIALVTGASQGIGRAIAVSLAREGAHVAVMARNATALDAVAAEMRGLAGKALAVPVDLTSPDQIEQGANRVIDELGTPEIVVSNAGRVAREGQPPYAFFEQLSDDDWQWAFDLNLMGPVRLIRTLLPRMCELGQGSIVIINSTGAAQPDPGVEHYDGTKAALLNLAKSLSREYGPRGIRVNTVSPGITLSDYVAEFLGKLAAQENRDLEEFVPGFVAANRPNVTAGRAARPREIADVVTFLASPRASFVNGANYRVDSGDTLSLV